MLSSPGFSALLYRLSGLAWLGRFFGPLPYGIIGAVVSCIWVMGSGLSVGGEPQRLRHEFEAEQPSWKVIDATTKAAMTLQFRAGIDPHGGQFCEQLEFHPPQTLADCQVSHPLPRARVFDELTLSLWVRSNCPNLRLALRVLFPHQIDPRTREPLVLDIAGERYTTPKEWQQLTCRPTEEILQRRLIRAREELSDGVRPVQIDSRDLIVTDAVLYFDVPAQPAAILIDDMELGPIVAAREKVAGVTPAATETPEFAPVRLEIGDRIFKEGSPFFPLFTIHQREDIPRIASLGVNMLWVPDYSDTKLLGELTANHLGAIAVPPHPSRDEASLKSASLPGFSPATTPIWAWMLGTQIPSRELAFVEEWADQIQSADHVYRRPLMGEVLQDQRAFHRKLTFLGSSRIPMQTALAPLTAMQRAQRHRALALPGKATFTFVATEPLPDIVDSQPGSRPFPALEPEQILMQSSAAIAAGYRGLGFWKQYSLDSDLPGMVEREHAIRLVCMQARLLEPFLASGRVVDEVSIQIGGEVASTQGGTLGGNNPFASRWDPKILPSGELKNPTAEITELKAYVLHSDVGVLILPVWLEEHAQFVPGSRIAKDVRLLFKGDATQAWEVTTTGIGTQLALRRIAGGTEVHLKELDLHSAIIVTHSQRALDELKTKSRLYRAEAARSWLLLAEAKLERTARVHEELEQLDSPKVSDANRLLQSSRALLERARIELEREDYDIARQDCLRALQYLRVLQRKHWDHAVAALSGPQASPYTCCFQSLPAHWLLLAEIGRRSQFSQNLLPSGSFEDQGEFVRANWQTTAPVPMAGATVGRLSIDPVGIVGQSALAFEIPYADQRSNSRGRAIPNPIPSPLAVRSPGVPVFAGDIVLISGQIRITRDLDAPEQGFLMYDSLRGEAGALEWTKVSSGWQPFRMIREIPRDMQLDLSLELRGRGRVEVDDLQLIRLPPVEAPSVRQASGNR
ncbi:MAG: hypothetical protein KDA90_12370 [Planctomycetaceae bacterium]|nr:hypothetical protein [Planctomycetaceae bacterium]